MKKIIIFLLLLVSSDCFAQYNPQFLWQPGVGNQINLAHPMAQGLVGAWLFNEGLGSKVYDISAYSNHGDLISTSQVTWVSTIHGYALDFDGTTGYVDLGTSRVIDFTIFSNWSLATWFKIDDLTGDDRTIVSRTNSGGGIQLNFRVDKGVTPQNLEVFNDGSLRLSSGNVIELDTWYFAVLTMNASAATENNLYIYDINGLLDTSTGDYDAEHTDIATMNTTIGKQLNGFDEMDGIIASVYYYDRILSLAEADFLHTSRHAIFETPPGRILAAAAAAAARRRFIRVF